MKKTPFKKPKVCSECQFESSKHGNYSYQPHSQGCSKYKSQILLIPKCRKYVASEEDIQFLNNSNAVEGVFDMVSLEQAVYAWEYLMNQDSITPDVILKTHKILMLKQDGLLPNQKGYFRNMPVYVGGKEAMPYTGIPDAIKDWCFLNDRARPLAFTSKDLHIRYENIHPFVDGNGRTGRMFMNWTRLKRLDESILDINPGVEQFEYYKWFK